MWLVKGMQCDGRARALDFGGCYLLTKEALDHYRDHYGDILRGRVQR